MYVTELSFAESRHCNEFRMQSFPIKSPFICGCKKCAVLVWLLAEQITAPKWQATIS